MGKLPVLIVVSILIAIIIAFVAIIFLRVYRFPFVYYTVLGATNSLTHWFAWIGTIYLVVASPIQPIIKRKAPTHYKTMLKIHMIGNLLAVLLVSIHFSQQVTRPATAYPELGTGILLYATMILLVSTGLLRYLGVPKQYFKQEIFLHSAFALMFYTVIIVHILHGISII
jgi:hypothetical protein